MDRHQGRNRGKKVRIVEKKSTGDGLSLVIISWGFIHGNAFVSVGVGGHGGGRNFGVLPLQLRTRQPVKRPSTDASVGPSIPHTSDSQK